MFDYDRIQRVRLKSFPKQLLQDIKITDSTFLDSFDDDFPKIIDEIHKYKF
ncbi:MAG: hypothetical protein ACLFOC_05950 [Campylobacterales bacterium]